MPTVVLATHNAKKLVELRRILEAAGLPDVAIRSLDDFPGAPEVAETGTTFAENALLDLAVAGCEELSRRQRQALAEPAGEAR